MRRGVARGFQSGAHYDADKGTASITVKGDDIPEDEQATVWEELARGTHTRDVAGSGLGLPFVKAIIERHGGTIELSSRLGEGTVVRMRLPVRV